MIKIYDKTLNQIKEVGKVHKSNTEWRNILTPEQYEITTRKGTERPFTFTFNDVKEPVIFRYIRCGTDLFSTGSKFDSGIGWPSYNEPVFDLNIRLQEDNSYGMHRTEVLCARCDAHLGHVFEDGPPPIRKCYCINSAALDFFLA